MAYGAIAAVCLIGNIIFLLIPPKNVVNSIAARSKQKRVTFVDEMSEFANKQQITRYEKSKCALGYFRLFISQNSRGQRHCANSS